MSLFKASIRAEYVLQPNANGVGVTCVLKNVYDETLQAKAAVTGKVEITWAENLQLKKVGYLTTANLAYARNYNSQTGVLTIDPGDSITVTYHWEITADSEAVLRGQIFTLKPDFSCMFLNIPRRYIADPETFIITGEVRVFQNTATVKVGQTDATFCLVTAYVPVRECPTVSHFPPCGLP
jgi:hypothetical protein